MFNGRIFRESIKAQCTGGTVGDGRSACEPNISIKPLNVHYY